MIAERDVWQCECCNEFTEDVCEDCGCCNECCECDSGDPFESFTGFELEETL